MVSLALSVVVYIRAFFVPRHQVALEAAALRQQLAVFKRKSSHSGPDWKFAQHSSNYGEAHLVFVFTTGRYSRLRPYFGFPQSPKLVDFNCALRENSLDS
jgi:hypothetical protein